MRPLGLLLLGLIAVCEVACKHHFPSRYCGQIDFAILRRFLLLQLCPPHASQMPQRLFSLHARIKKKKKTHERTVHKNN